MGRVALPPVDRRDLGEVPAVLDEAPRGTVLGSSSSAEARSLCS
jgi:hypothetical protein